MNKKKSTKILKKSRPKSRPKSRSKSTSKSRTLTTSNERNKKLIKTVALAGLVAASLYLGAKHKKSISRPKFWPFKKKEDNTSKYPGVLRNIYITTNTNEQALSPKTKEFLQVLTGANPDRFPQSKSAHF